MYNHNEKQLGSLFWKTRLEIKSIVEFLTSKKKTEQISNRSQRREAAHSMQFLINIVCLSTYDVE